MRYFPKLSQSMKLDIVHRKEKQMEREYKKLSNKVIVSKDNKDNDLYFAKAEGAAPFNNLFYDEDSLYAVSAKDIEIVTGESSYTEAVVLTYCKDDEAGNTHFIDVIVCCMLGTFISDWY